jgi:hypothetical protein
MPCYQRQRDENPCSPNYTNLRLIEVPCPPDIVCQDDTVAAGPLSATVTLLCYSGGVRITVNQSGGTGLVKYSLDGSAFQSSNVFQVVSLPSAGMSVQIWDTAIIGRIKTINTGTVDCDAAEESEYKFEFTYTEPYYCWDGVTVYATATIDVYTNGQQRREKITSVVGSQSC